MSNKFINFANSFVLNISKIKSLDIQKDHVIIHFFTKSKELEPTLNTYKTIKKQYDPKGYKAMKKWIKNLQKV
jgi:hypothetical protein